MNVANSITIIRILLVPVFIISLVYNHLGLALIIFATAAFTDGLDGFIARAFNQKTVLGSYLDPTADKLLLLAAYLTLAVKNFLPSWLAVIVVSRDVILVVCFLARSFMEKRTFVIRPTFVSKATTFFQLLTIFCVLLSLGENLDYLQFLYLGTAALTVMSGLDYISMGLKSLS
jgi:cardiolipin synthase